jgi:uncharacterized protein YcbX
VDTADAGGFAEDAWLGRTIRIGDEVRLDVTGPCPRCVMTTLAQADLPKDSDVPRTAARHHDVTVGVHASVTRPGGIGQCDAVRLEPA